MFNLIFFPQKFNGMYVITTLFLGFVACTKEDDVSESHLASGSKLLLPFVDVLAHYLVI
jgi:hypothetical protein